MRSIRSRFLLMNLISLLLCAVMVGGLGLWSVSALQRDSSKDILSLTCRTEGSELNEVLHSIQDSVDIFCDYTDARLSSVEMLRNDYFISAFYADVERSMLNIASKTRGVCACYFRTALELTDKPEGFFYSVHDRAGGLVKETLTDLSLYDPDDTEHVGWYYQPKAAGHAIWMEPYFNKNLGIYMISYVSPLYRDGVFWGIVGMDIDFDVVIEHVREIRPYSTGYAFLVSDEGKVYYHPEIPVGEMLTAHSSGLEPLLDYFKSEHDPHEDERVFRYHYKGVGKDLSAFRLANGMELLLTASRREIKAPMVSLFQFITVVTILLCTFEILVVVHVSNRITGPLDKLTRAAEEIATGNMDVELPAAGEDEVGILTRSLAVTVSSLKQHISRMYDMAYTDPLTRVKNKTAYAKECLALEEQMARGERDFGLLMLDLNRLKAINDKFGHERGDEYLIGCCNLMCSVFKHSPVYRVGGDEFLVLLRGEDLEQASSRLEELDYRMARSAGAREAWKRYSIAKGLALCQPEDKTPEAVFKRADTAMYADKRRMKQKK